MKKSNFIPSSTASISSKSMVGMVDKLIMPITIKSAFISKIK
jgi:hypothetical protein